MLRELKMEYNHRNHFVCLFYKWVTHTEANGEEKSNFGMQYVN